jgi:hypothetical protein
MEKNNCSCKAFDGKENHPKDIEDNFDFITRSKPKKSFSTKGKYTSLIKCPKCYSYYLMNIYNPRYSNQKTLSIRKYDPKVEERLLIGTLKFLEGIVTDSTLDEYSAVRASTDKFLKTLRKD